MADSPLIPWTLDTILVDGRPLAVALSIDSTAAAQTAQGILDEGQRTDRDLRPVVRDCFTFFRLPFSEKAVVRLRSEAPPLKIPSVQEDRVAWAEDASRKDYAWATQTIDEMHRAACGGVVSAPKRGVVEDIADLYADRNQLVGQVTQLRRDLEAATAQLQVARTELARARDNNQAAPLRRREALRALLVDLLQALDNDDARHAHAGAEPSR